MMRSDRLSGTEYLSEFASPDTLWCVFSGRSGHFRACYLCKGSKFHDENC